MTWLLRVGEEAKRLQKTQGSETDNSEKYCLVGISFNEVLQHHDCQELENYAFIKKMYIYFLWRMFINKQNTLYTSVFSKSYLS